MPKVTLSKEYLEEIVRTSKSFRGVSRKTGLTRFRVNQLIELYTIPTEHFMFGKINLSYVGKTFNRLTITGITKKNKHHYAVCNCICGKIGSVHRIENVVRGQTPSCGCQSKSRPAVLGRGNPAFVGVGEIGSSLFKRIRRDATRRGLSFEITIEYAWKVFQAQQGLCALTGIPIGFGRIRNYYETTASLDRINSNLGYIQENVQWVFKPINVIKKDIEESYFIELCQLVADWSRQNKQNTLSLQEGQENHKNNHTLAAVYNRDILLHQKTLEKLRSMTSKELLEFAKNAELIKDEDVEINATVYNLK